MSLIPPISTIPTTMLCESTHSESNCIHKAAICTALTMPGALSLFGAIAFVRTGEISWGFCRCLFTQCSRADGHENINSVFSWQMLCTAHNKFDPSRRLHASYWRFHSFLSGEFETWKCLSSYGLLISPLPWKKKGAPSVKLNSKKKDLSDASDRSTSHWSFISNSLSGRVDIKTQRTMRNKEKKVRSKVQH